MTPGWLDALVRCSNDLVPSVLVTVIGVRGSAPRDSGTKMVFTADGQDDTIGGGALEYECGRVAHEILRSRAGQPLTRDFPLGPALGQCCGGHVTVLFEPILPSDWSVVVFGAGHVGQAMIRLLAMLPCRVLWVDSRAELFGNLIPSNVTCDSGPVEGVAIPLNSMVLAMSHDHQLDYQIVRTCLKRDDLQFVGLIGSDTKNARFRSRLLRDGLPAASVSRLTCPIGFVNVGSKIPAEIAVSVAAQLLSIRGAQHHSAASVGGTEPISLPVSQDVGRCRGCVG